MIEIVYFNQTKKTQREIYKDLVHDYIKYAAVHVDEKDLVRWANIYAVENTVRVWREQ